MSRGLGVIQRGILETLTEQGAGAGIFAYQFGGNTRRAAHTLARRGLVRIEYRHHNGRRYMLIRPQRALG